MAAALELQQEDSGDNLRDRLKGAGIVSSSASGNSVLERLKAKRAGKPPVA